MAAHTTPRSLAGAGQALLRWKLGHHAFHLHLAAMNTLLADADRFLESVRWAELAEALDRLCILYDGATATMRYAADFSPDMYQRLIRPSMAPPFTSPGFSGTLNLEHKLMLGQLRELRAKVNALRARGALPREVQQAALQLWTAQSRNRSNHVLICQRFVPDGKSLLSEFFRARREAEAAGGEPPDGPAEEKE